MSGHEPPPLQPVLDEIELLDAEDQAAVIEIIKRRLIERRRGEIAQNARHAMQSFREGRAQYGTVDDLRRDLERGASSGMPASGGYSSG